MKEKSKLMSYALMFIAFGTSCAAVAAQAQSREPYVISAKAGGVNWSSGGVTLRRQGATAWQPLGAKDELNTGDVMRTGADGRVEVLLNPGSYLRVDVNSEVELADASLDSLRVRLIKGSSVIEATGTDGTRLLAEVNTAQTRIVIDRNGLYRINVLPGGATEVLVYKGKALVGRDRLAVKGGKKIIVGSGPVEVTKFDKKHRDEFSLWSKRRGEELAAANRRLSDRAVTNALASFRRNGAFGYGFAPYFGLWVYDASLSCYTFLPFYSGWSSPYGRGYRNGFGIPWYYNRPTPLVGPNPNPGGGVAGTIPTPTPSPVVGSPGRRPGRRMPVDVDNPDGRPLRPHRPPLGRTPRSESADRFERDLGNRGGAPDRGFNGSGRDYGAPSAPMRPSPTYTQPPPGRAPADRPARREASPARSQINPQE